jgi:hypothetical protein
VKDFAAAWNKVMNLDRFDLRKVLFVGSTSTPQPKGLPQGSPSAYPCTQGRGGNRRQRWIINEKWDEQVFRTRD